MSRLKAEHALLAQLDHPDIPKVFDFLMDEVNSQAYLVMEYMDGVPLDEYVQNNGVFTEAETKKCISQL